MKEEECPKCDDVVRPKWHKGSADNLKSRCHEESNVKYSREHNHYYCKCGYDWIIPIEEKDSGIIEI